MKSDQFELFSVAPGSMVLQNDQGEYEVTYAATGVYTFTCTATDSDGNTDTESVDITVGSYHSMYSSIIYHSVYSRYHENCNMSQNYAKCNFSIYFLNNISFMLLIF